jgi:hypothetical protein
VLRGDHGLAEVTSESSVGGGWMQDAEGVVAWVGLAKTCKGGRAG